MGSTGNLSLGYPRRAPQCKMVHPVFHPNFDATSVCIGDFWAPSEGLDDLIVRIGRMIALAEELSEKPPSEWTEEDIKAQVIKHAPEHVQRSRLRVDARKWIASKLKPKKYGDYQKHEHTGSLVTEATLTFVGSADET